MRKLRLYLRLAGQNLVANRLYYAPFLLTATFCAALCYIMRFLSYNELVANMPGSMWVGFMLSTGSAIMAYLVLWIMGYANRFVMRRRKRELALYNVLGMGKGHIACIMAAETLFLAVAAVVLGIGGGGLLSKLVLVLLLRLMRTEIPMGFEFCRPGAVETAVVFAALFALLYLCNLWQVCRARPIELLHSDKAGEREPKTRSLQAFVGLAALCGGYAISAFTTEMVLVIVLFFVAVVLVIWGTHWLFGAGSIVLLKALRKNKRFYYKPRNFTAVSGLIYRMNQNARGLANICILSTTVLVSVAVTVCLYTGMEDSLRRNFPHEVEASAYIETSLLDGADFTAFDVAVQNTAAAQAGLDPAVWRPYTALTTTVQYTAEGYSHAPRQHAKDPDCYNITVLTAADYTALSGKAAALNQGEVLFDGKTEDGAARFGALRFTVTGTPEAIPPLESAYEFGANTATLVLPDTAALAALCGAANAGGDGFGRAQHGIFTDVAIADDNAVAAIRNAASDALAGIPALRQNSVYTVHRAAMRVEYNNMFGSFLFLGVFLGLMFTLATVLIIYYKQLSEGYEDRDRFVILQQVGMSAAEVRSTIRRQVLLVFFLPLVMAAVHLAAAFPMLRRMISVFGLTDISLFIGCCIVTLALFAVCYVVVYAVTARQYYRIVRMGNL